MLRDFDEVFASIRSASYATLLWGLRGTGKTVLLNAIEDRAAEHGWVSISAAVARPLGLIEQLASRADRMLRSLAEEPEGGPKRELSGVSVLGLGIHTERAPQEQRAAMPSLDLEASLAALGDLLANRGAGVVITLDELHVCDVEEIKEFGSVFQIVSRRAERPIAFVGAALPELEHRLLPGPVGTFLQRCRRHQIDNLRASEARTALRQPIEDVGARIDDEALDLAATASRGQPYLVQLVGACAWDNAADPVAGIRLADVSPAVSDAIQMFGDHVYGPVWYRLSDLDKALAVAMLADRGSSSVADVGERWGHSSRSLSNYRRRLISAGLIVSVGRGRIAFVDDAARAFVQQQAEAEGWLDAAPA